MQVQRVTIQAFPSDRTMIDVPDEDPLSPYLLWVAERGARPGPLIHRIGSWQEIHGDAKARASIERDVRLRLMDRMDGLGLLPLSRTLVRWHVARHPYGESLEWRYMNALGDLSMPVHMMPLVGDTDLMPTDWLIAEGRVAVVKVPPAGSEAAEALLRVPAPRYPA